MAVHQPTAPPTAIGETIALPTRLLGHANAGEILVSPQIGRQIAALVDLQPRHVQLGTASTDWVAAYRAVRLKRQLSTLTRCHGSAFLGREQELAILQEQRSQAAAGHGQVVGIVGEPGVGKSRLIAEFLQHSRTGHGTVLAAAGQSYGRSVPYLPVLDLLRQCCNLMPSDRAEIVAAKFDTALHHMGLEATDIAPYMHRLLGLHREPDPLAHLSPETIKKRTFAALRQLLLARSQQHPLVVVLEDLQWIDQTSEAWCTALVESLHGMAVLFLNTYRPGYRPP